MKENEISSVGLKKPVLVGVIDGSMTTRAPNVNINLLYGNINNVKHYGKGFSKKTQMSERFNKIMQGYNALQNLKQGREDRK